MAESLWKTDAEKATFRAEVGRYEAGLLPRVTLHPRKSEPGWVWVVWHKDKNFIDHGEAAIVEEGTIDASLNHAASFAVEHLMRITGNHN